MGWLSGNALRQEISARNLVRATQGHAHELTFGAVPHVVYAADEAGEHGNFHPAAWRRIQARPEWRRRLEKTYTSSARVPRAGDRRRAELECATSSDALLMNVFCSPRVLCRPAFCALLGVGPGAEPEFGVRADLLMRRGEVDRTELDMRLGPLLVEAKLTEANFGTASRERLLRYVGLEEVFDVDALVWTARGVQGYQLVRGVLAALAADATFVVLIDGRRADLAEIWLRTAAALRGSALRDRLRLRTWQELAATLPLSLQGFLAEKYGVAAADSRAAVDGG